MNYQGSRNDPFSLLQIKFSCFWVVKKQAKLRILLDKMCILDLQFDPDVCYNLTHGIRIDKNMSDRVQNSAASLEVFDGILVALPAVLFSLFVGAWSDARGRKAVLILCNAYATVDRFRMAFGSKHPDGRRVLYGTPFTFDASGLLRHCCVPLRLGLCQFLHRGLRLLPGLR